uniref:Uncharacterized protein n=1 Tax=viral metagenome TaxID=1070528 RepID=A0A6M3LL14_9ZZZZ
MKITIWADTLRRTYSDGQLRPCGYCVELMDGAQVKSVNFLDTLEEAREEAAALSKEQGGVTWEIRKVY